MQHHAVTVVTPPAADDPVVTLTEAKLHLRVEHDADDELIEALVLAATEQAQSELRRQLVTATLLLQLDAFSSCIELPRGARSVLSVDYDDETGNEQTLDDATYLVDVDSLPGRLTLADGYSWPSTYPGSNAVRITYTAGYGAAAAVPAGIKAWIKLHVGALYRSREAFALGASVSELPGRFTAGLLDPYRIIQP